VFSICDDWSFEELGVLNDCFQDGFVRAAGVESGLFELGFFCAEDFGGGSVERFDEVFQFLKCGGYVEVFDDSWFNAVFSKEIECLATFAASGVVVDFEVWHCFFGFLYA